ncbi:hypothetical protein ACS0TY_024721 [Phlomoides rotata]
MAAAKQTELAKCRAGAFTHAALEILGVVLIVIGLYSVLWGKYKEYKEKESEENLDPVKDGNQNIEMVEDIEANNVLVHRESKMSIPAVAISAPILPC